MKLSNALAAVSAALSLVACNESVPTVSGPTLESSVPSAALSASQADVFMDKLNNPRGLVFGPDGGLYVAEAGRGYVAEPGSEGASPPCYLILGTTNCYGPTGSVSRKLQGLQERIVTGLPSAAVLKSGRAEGPNGVAFVGSKALYVTIGLEADPAVRIDPTLMGFGRLVEVSPSVFSRGKGAPQAAPWRFVADISGFEAATNFDCGEVDSNPFALLGEQDRLLITDAGANTVLSSNPSGHLSVFAIFSSSHTEDTGPDCPLPVGYPTVQPQDMVPTSIVRGPDGAYYVSQLEGFPIHKGAANIWRVVPGEKPEVFLRNFTFVTSIAFDASGNLYVLQNSGGPRTPPLTGQIPGSLIRVIFDGTPDGTRTTVLEGLNSPASVVVGPDGGIYVSNFSSNIALGQVLRINP